MATSNEKTSQNGANKPLYRVNYTYTVGNQIRNGQYVVNASSVAEAKAEAEKILQPKHEGSGSAYRIGNIKPF